ncbi:hypothetical protein [Ideonella sp.]|jgi:hypothetical protein|uniref:hypothetical protein n=1 Tax=Ideonella sp. TaxID=1929293 RepID=UPI0037BFBCD4
MDDSLNSAMPLASAQRAACGPHSAAASFCMTHSWEALRPWLGAALADDEHEPDLLIHWLAQAPAHCRAQAQAALRAMRCGPWEVEHVPHDGRLSVRLHSSAPPARWRLKLHPAQPGGLIRLDLL